MIGSRLFKLLPREIPKCLKAILRFFHTVVMVPKTSKKLKSSILNIGYSVIIYYLQ